MSGDHNRYQKPDYIDRRQWKYDPMTGEPLVDDWEWQWLTDSEIGDIIEQSQITLKNYCSEEKQTEFARAIEAALKAKNG